MHRRELAGDDGDGLGRVAGGVERVEHGVGHRHLGRRTGRPGRELPVVFGQARNAEGVVDEHLAVALGDRHGREDGARGIGPDQQVDLVDRDQLLIERAREVGLRLVVEQHPFDRPAEQAAALVEVLDIHLADDLVDHGGRGERAGQRQGAADTDRLARRLGQGRPAECQRQGAGGEAADHGAARRNQGGRITRRDGRHRFPSQVSEAPAGIGAPAYCFPRPRNRLHARRGCYCRAPTVNRRLAG